MSFATRLFARKENAIWTRAAGLSHHVDVIDCCVSLISLGDAPCCFFPAVLDDGLLRHRAARCGTGEMGALAGGAVTSFQETKDMGRCGCASCGIPRLISREFGLWLG